MGLGVSGFSGLTGFMGFGFRVFLDLFRGGLGALGFGRSGGLGA